MTVPRFVDVVIATAFLLVVLPLYVPLAIVNRLTTGQWYFRQVRIGCDLRAFPLLKFHSMARGAEGGSTVTASTDRRITPYGRALRALKLDELPQLINILRGDMSLLGPRPLTPNEVAAIPPVQAQRLYRMRPGLTGLSAVAFADEERWLARFSDPEQMYFAAVLPRKVALELAYADRRTWTTDLIIAVLTPAAPFFPGLRRRVVRYLTGETADPLWADGAAGADAS